MPLDKGKHIIMEIKGTRCSLVETGATSERMQFLKDLLTLNKYDVKTEVDPKNKEGGAVNYVIGVTDLLFNPVIEVYKRSLKSKTGHKVTPAYWLQISDAETEAEVNYWTFK